jgi:hypothetical protein
VTNKSVYHGFSSRWFYYTAIVMVLQSFTIKLNTELYFAVDVDLLVLHSSLTVFRVRDVLDRSPLNSRKFQSHTSHSRATFVVMSSGSPLIYRKLLHTHPRRCKLEYFASITAVS